MRQDVDAHAARVFAGTLLILMVGFVACSAATAVSPSTRDTIVRTALDEAKYQCLTNPPNDARLQAACLALIGPAVEQRDAATVDDSPVSGDGGPVSVEQGNATRRVEDGGQ